MDKRKIKDSPSKVLTSWSLRISFSSLFLACDLRLRWFEIPVSYFSDFELTGRSTISQCHLWSGSPGASFWEYGAAQCQRKLDVKPGTWETCHMVRCIELHVVIKLISNHQVSRAVQYKVTHAQEHRGQTFASQKSEVERGLESLAWVCRNFN